MDAIYVLCSYKYETEKKIAKTFKHNHMVTFLCFKCALCGTSSTVICNIVYSSITLICNATTQLHCQSFK